MEVFVRAEVPEYCYIHEATHWIAFGVIPPFWPNKEGKDERSEVDLHLDDLEALGGPVYYPLAPILNRLVPDADGTEFLRHSQLCWGQSVEEVLGRIARYRDLYEKVLESQENKKTRHRFLDEFDIEQRQLEIELESARHTTPVTDALDQLVEVARARLFSALVQGQVTARGIRT